MVDPTLWPFNRAGQSFVDGAWDATVPTSGYETTLTVEQRRAAADIYRATYNHTRGDSALTPCPWCREFQGSGFRRALQGCE